MVHVTCHSDVTFTAGWNKFLSVPYPESQACLDIHLQLALSSALGWECSMSGYVTQSMRWGGVESWTRGDTCGNLLFLWTEA